MRTALLLTALSLAAPGPASGNAGRRAVRGIIFISLGNVGARHMSLYGYGRKTTPKIDRWASRAVVFENAFSHASWTLPVATSLFTSLYPYTHGVLRRDYQNSLSTAILTLPEILREKGYRTAAFTGGLDYNREFSTMRGFQDASDNPNFTSLEVTLDQAKTWLKKNGKARFFLFVHGYDAHCPFTPPESARGTFSARNPRGVTVDPSRCVRGFRRPENGGYEAYYAGGCPEFRRSEPCKRGIPTRVDLRQADIDYLMGLYDETVLAADARVGAFLESLGKDLLNETIVVVFAEHGEMFAKHGRFGRAGTVRGTLYDDVIHVPLIIRAPRIAGRRVSGLAQIIDIMPTVLALAGIPLKDRVQGRSLLPLIHGGGAVNRFVFAGLPYNLNQQPFFYDGRSVNDSIRNSEWKLIRESVRFESLAWRFKHGYLSYPTGRWSRLYETLRHPFGRTEESVELYDIQDDPGEMRNLAARYPEVVRKLEKRLTRWKEDSRRFTPHLPGTRPIPENILKEARERGYW